MMYDYQQLCIKKGDGFDHLLFLYINLDKGFNEFYLILSRYSCHLLSVQARP